ncbi:MAG: sensor histidine kinase, partial [Bacilli bacterium]
MSNRKKVMWWIIKLLSYLALSAGIALVLCIVGYNLLYGILVNTPWTLFHDMLRLVNNIKNATLGDTVYILIYIFITLCIYSAFLWRSAMQLVVIQKAVEEIAEGDLTKRVPIRYRSEFSGTAENINAVIERFSEVAEQEKYAQQTKTELITNVSHDLKTPLTSILGYLALIEDDRYKDEVELRYYTNIAYRKAQSLDILIKDLFELTKLQNSGLNLECSEVNLSELIRQVVLHLEDLAKERHKLLLTKVADEQIVISADTTKLVRALQNLIANAIQYGDDQTDVHI